MSSLRLVVKLALEMNQNSGSKHAQTLGTSSSELRSEHSGWPYIFSEINQEEPAVLESRPVRLPANPNPHTATQQQL